MNSDYNMNNDLLLVAYYLNDQGWSAANKSTFQRILYFSAALSPIFVPHEDWAYEFSNTMFGPYNNDISKQLSFLSVKELLILEERKMYQNRIEERFRISDKGISECVNKLFLLDYLKRKKTWFEIIVRTLGIYGESFLSKLVKEDPNVVSFNMANKNSKLPTDDSDNNLSKQFFEFIKEKGKERIDLDQGNDQDFLLLFFDVLYRKYKEGSM